MAVNMSKKDEEALAAAGAAWNAANAAGDKAGMEKAHADAEAIRAGYGFSGGADGSEFIALPGTRASNTYVPVDNSGNDYAEMVGMSDVHQAALEAAGKAWNAATTDEARDAAHAKAEAIRALYGYSGGGDGSEYIPLTKAPTVSLGGGFSYASAPTYTDKYTSQIEDILNGILNRDDFSYDALNDPLYQQYKAQYQREGQRAMKDTLGQMAARTGGLASSYATTAAQQANDYYVSQIADKIPELYQLAYSMYLDDIDLKVQDMGLLQDMSDTQYSRYRDTMSDWRDDRNFAYGMYRDDIADDKWATEFNYGLSRDQIADSRYDQEYSDSRSDLEYERNQITKAEAQDRVNAYLAAFGSVSDLDNSIITASGYTNAELMALEKYYADQKAKQTASGDKGSSGGGSPSTTKPTLTAAQALSALESGIVNDTTKAAFEYYYGQEWDGGGTEEPAEPETEATISNRHGDSWIYIPGHGRFSYQEVEKYVNSGQVIETYDPATNTYSYKWNNSYNQ